MPLTQILPIRTQIKYVAALEALVNEGKYRSRNAVANAAIAFFLDTHTDKTLAA